MSSDLRFPSESKLRDCLEQHPLMQKSFFPSEHFLIDRVIETFTNSTKNINAVLSEINKAEELQNDQLESCLRGERVYPFTHCGHLEERPIQQIFRMNLTQILTDCAKDNASWVKKSISTK